MNIILYNYFYGFDNVINVDGRKLFLLDNNFNDFYFWFYIDVDYIINIICVVIVVLGGIGNIVIIVIILY